MDTEQQLQLLRIVGVVIVFWVFFHRFSVVPDAFSQSEGTEKPWAKPFRWVGLGSGHAYALFPPPRANTTLFKFKLYQTVYAVGWLLAYLLVLEIPAVADQIQKVIKMASGPEFAIPADSGPLVLAFIVAALLPMVPPFKQMDSAIRRILYEQAAIPAQQLRERSRLKNAQYAADPQVLENVTKRLSADGFNPADLAYDENDPTTRSLWTKASLLTEHIALWQGKDKYTTAFALLRERDGSTLSVDVVRQNHEALEGDAKACFEAMREAPEEPETAAREEAFRRNCKDLLERIYDLLSRVSLHAHYSERERVLAMNQLGFRLALDEVGPIPGHNDLLWLAVIIAVSFVFPLARYSGVGGGRAIVIGLIMFITVLTPLVLASKFPRLAAPSDSGAPAITFQAVAGCVAMALGALVSIAYHSLPELDLVGAASHYTERGYPWTLMYGFIAVLIAWRMGVGSYPDTRQLKGIARYRVWGDLRDVAIFFVCIAAFMVFVVGPLLHFTDYVKPTALVLVPSCAVGFFVPTWYRAHARRRRQERRVSGAARAEFQSQINALYKSAQNRKAAV